MSVAACLARVTTSGMALRGPRSIRGCVATAVGRKTRLKGASLFLLVSTGISAAGCLLSLYQGLVFSATPLKLR